MRETTTMRADSGKSWATSAGSQPRRIGTPLRVNVKMRLNPVSVLVSVSTEIRCDSVRFGADPKDMKTPMNTGDLH